MANNRFSLVARFLTFRRELGVLWRAFMAPETPMHLKVLMLAVPLYLLSPIDLIPDVIPFLGWVDDLVVIPMLVSWIVGRLPQPVRVNPGRDNVIDGTARRL
jgi:uncharacterized membrane protein YkvA (DUF1232 family)